MRGLGLPACRSGVTVPISTKPNPRANKAGYMRPSLSNPAASPIGLFTVFPKSFVCRTTTVWIDVFPRLFGNLSFI